ncbi:MAG: ROK family transcriptional regulator [Bacteroidales bacterium]|uniref:ROK family transcriptional regulator n=1 Tax=Porphyromonas sp. TaxID=1924944 RepID=UPI00297A235A|nr:ROK family transcriptional regulator [Porphyromonas sp.]MDD7438170.1 ROK family transcriptional regulator [Bacteroidales bacterium]MDY3066817.1 ROK family transcriptional regulator [Porphyromonas sp.]
MTESEFRDLFDTNPKNLQYKQRIVEYLVENGPETLPVLAKHLEVSVPTISKMVGELVDHRLLRNFGKLEATTGRHPFLFGLTDKDYFFLGVDFSASHMNFVLMDFSGNQVQSKMDVPFHFENTQGCLDTISTMVNDYLDHEITVPRTSVVSIGINIIGRLNPHTGYSYTNFNFNEVPLAKRFTDIFGIPTYIDNDARAAAYGEYMLHYKSKGENLLFVNVTWGLGLGIIINGEPYAGKSGFSGEFGHTHCYENEVLCYCGKKGCLETEASGLAMHRKFTDRVKAGDRSILLDEGKKIEEVTLDDLIEATRREDMLCIEILEEVGEQLGLHLANMINIFNPHVVVIGGPLAEVGDYLIQPIQSAIRKYSLNMVNQDTELKQSILLHYAGVMGASLLARKKAIASLTD